MLSIQPLSSKKVPSFFKTGIKFNNLVKPDLYLKEMNECKVFTPEMSYFWLNFRLYDTDQNTVFKN